MIEAAGLAFPRAPLDAVLARLAVGSLFDALVVATTAPGKFRLSVLGTSLDLETALPLEVGERVRLAVKSKEPLTLEIRPAVAKPEEPTTGQRALTPELEAAVRAFAGGDVAREEAARFLAGRGLGLDPGAARGLALLLARPSAAGAWLAVPALTPPADANDMVRVVMEAMKAPSSGLTAASRVAIDAAMARLSALPEFRALLDAAAEGPDAAMRAAAALRSLPAARDALVLLDSGRALADVARALQALNGDAASRGDGVFYFAFGWARSGRPEGGFGRVESRPGGAADPDAPARVVVTLDLTRLGLVQVAIALAAGAASVTVAASAPSRRLLERDRAGLVEALVRLGLRADLRFSDGPLESVLPLPAGGLDVRA